MQANVAELNQIENYPHENLFVERCLVLQSYRSLRDPFASGIHLFYTTTSNLYAIFDVRFLGVGGVETVGQPCRTF